jgi:hypothetical protein
MSPIDILRSVRDELDSLATFRLQMPLDPALQRAYQALCAQEQELLRPRIALPA